MSQSLKQTRIRLDPHLRRLCTAYEQKSVLREMSVLHRDIKAIEAPVFSISLNVFFYIASSNCHGHIIQSQAVLEEALVRVVLTNQALIVYR